VTQTGRTNISGTIDADPLLRALWSSRWLIVGITMVFAAMGTTYSLLATEWYQADVVLMQAESRASPDLTQLGGLASLAGINLSGISSNQAPLAVLRSREVAREFIVDQKLLPLILLNQRDVANDGRKDGKSGEPYDIREAVARFDKRIRSVTDDKKAGLITLSITWVDPNQAADWANLLVQRVNARMRNQAIIEAEANIAYLREQLSANSIAPLQQSIAGVLESEMRKLMLARGSEEYAFKVIDRAVPPKRRVRPQRAVIVAASLMLGLFVSFVYVVAWRGWVTNSR
jgi:uncharacterized protein involved in exopolysaccharide biosynthesis